MAYYIEFLVTCNFPGEEFDKTFTFPSLGELGEFLNKEFPDATSFVVVWTVPHAPR